MDSLLNNWKMKIDVLNLYANKLTVGQRVVTQSFSKEPECVFAAVGDDFFFNCLIGT